MNFELHCQCPYHCLNFKTTTLLLQPNCFIDRYTNRNWLRLNHTSVIWTSIQNLFAVAQSENKLNYFPSEYASSHTPSNCQVLPTDLKIAAKIVCDASMVGYRLINLDFNSRFQQQIGCSASVPKLKT